MSSPMHALPRTLVALLALASCESSGSAPGATASSGKLPQAKIENQQDGVAEVVAVDPKERMVTLSREDGSLTAVYDGSAVRNFDQIAVGDKVRAQYKELLVVTLCPPGTKPTPVEGAFIAGRAKSGAKPAGGMIRDVSMRVRIESIDRENGIVVYSVAGGDLRSHRIKTSEGREFIERVKIGDTVQVDYTEALTMAVKEQ